MSSLPQITIILPTYNRRNFLPSAIRCITAQTFKEWRLLVINDGGEDVSDIVKEFNDPRIEYIDLPHQGKPAVVNHGLQLVKSKYIAYMDDDDEVFPEHLEKLYHAAEVNNSQFVYSDTYLTVLNEKGEIVSKTIENDTDVTYEDIRFYNRINHKQILHTRELAEKVGFYDERISIEIDYDYIKRLAKLENPYHVRQVTGDHFLRGNMQSQITGLSTKNPESAGKSLVAFFEKDPEGLLQIYQNNMLVKIENDSLKSTLAEKNAENDSLKYHFKAAHNELSEIKASIAFKMGILLATPWRCCKRVIGIDVIRVFKDIRCFIYINKYGQFDNEWYLSNNPDVAEVFENSFWHKLDLMGIPVISQIGRYMVHPLRHYIKCGCHEHRNPTAFFDGDKYCSKYSDVNSNVINPFYHYLKFGALEGRKLDPVIKIIGSTCNLIETRSYFLQPDDMNEIKFKSKKIAVHLHLHSTDLIDEVISYLNNIPVKFDLFVSVVDQDCGAVANRLKKGISQLNSVQVNNVPGYGRNIGPLLITFGKKLLKYDFFCHIHTEKDSDDQTLKNWKKYLFSHLLGSAEQITGILNLLNRDGKFVFPKPFYFTTDRTNRNDLFQEVQDLFAGKGVKIPDYSTVEFPRCSMFWCRSNCLKLLLQLKLKWSDFPEEPVEAGCSKEEVWERSLLISAKKISGVLYCLQDIKFPERGEFYEGTQYDFSNVERKYSKVKLLSYYLPQFHPTPENDLWHGKGFTEWTSTKSANPLFYGHYQQHIPHDDIGFYLLDSPDVLIKQAEMMKKAGIFGQIFYHYWFTGKLILEKPAQMLLAHPEINMPFCFCWANENWTKCWDGNEREILLEQRYSEEDAESFINYLIPFFKDPRYIKVGNRPVLFIYRVNSFPDFIIYKNVWDQICSLHGVEKPYLVATLTRGVTSPEPYNMDAAVERVLHDWTNGNVPDKKALFHKFQRMTGSVLDYSEVAEYYINEEKKLPNDFTLFRSIVPQWDNTARYHERALLLHQSTPEVWGNWLKAIVSYSEEKLPEEQCFAVVNAWNEWAEGAHLEPDMHSGYAYLNTVGRVLCGKEKMDSYKDLIMSSIKKMDIQITFSPMVCDKLKADPCLKHKMLGTLERSIRFLRQKGLFCCFSESFDSELLTGKRCEVPDVKINVFDLCLFMENTLWEACRTYALYPDTNINVSPLNTTENVVVLDIKGNLELKQSRSLRNTNVFFMAENDKKTLQKDKISTVIRCCASNNLSLLENAFLSLLAQKNCNVKIYLCLQDFKEDDLKKMRDWIATFPWDGDFFPEILTFSSTEECKDLRSLMLNKGLEQVDNDAFVTFLDYDDIIFFDGYAALADRLKETQKTVSFARVFQTYYSAEHSVIKSRICFYEPGGSSFQEFFDMNFAPIHSFMIDKSKIDVSKIHYHPTMKYMEDYYMMLQILTPDNGDYELLHKKHYIGDYFWFTDMKNTLAVEKSVSDWMKNSEYRKCQELVTKLRNSLRLAHGEQ